MKKKKILHSFVLKIVFKQIKHVFIDSYLFSLVCIKANHKGKMQDMQLIYQEILALLRLIYKHDKQGFLQNNRINTKNSKFWWLPWKQCDNLLIQHPISVQQLGIVNIYPKLQEYMGVKNPVRKEGFHYWPWTNTDIPNRL